MPKHFKVHDVLTAAELTRLQDFVRDPGSTVDEAWELVKSWLADRTPPETISRGAIWSWRDSFRLGEEVSKSMQMSRAYLDAVKDGGGEMALADAAVLQVSQLISESLMEKKLAGEISDETLNNACLQLQRLALAKLRIESTKTEFQDRERQAVTAAKEIVKAGGDSASVADKVAEILGIS